MSHLIRYLLTGMLLYGVYTETGIWTTICLALLTLMHEIPVFFKRHPVLGLKIGMWLRG